MLFVPPCAKALRAVKTRLSEAIPHIPSSHLTEALAAAAGFKTNAALRASLWEPGKAPESCAAFEFHDGKFLQRLQQFGHEDVGEWPGFSRFAEREWVSSMYRSDRALCARNLITAAVVSGLTQGHFGLGPEDNFWPGTDETKRLGRVRATGFLFHVWMPEGIPTVAWVEDNGMGELTIKVACWPKGDHISYSGGFRSGEATAVGWLERDRGAWIMNDHRGGIDLAVRRTLQGRIAKAISPTTGFADQGAFIF
ncbi:MAG: hypothetical protein E6Q71_02425 [Pseudomonas sp.]|nr:MAG: hypothetical protein E6Q71_02425 [Pseudomonas sp.]